MFLIPIVDVVAGVLQKKEQEEMEMRTGSLIGAQIFPASMEKVIMWFIFLPLLLTQCPMTALAMSLTNFTTDQSALLEFKAHITSDPGNIISSNWSSASLICSWVGVSCGTRHCRVTALDLPNMNLSGSLPPHLGNLSFLISFNLSGNGFQGHLPPELGNLCRLKLIDLSYNFFQGSIPEEIGVLSNLEIFIVGHNQISNSIPLAIYNISSLQVLDLMSNYKLTGSISRNIRNLTKLREIYLVDTEISGEIPWEMGDLHNLEILAAGNANLSGPIPPNTFNISSLRWIYLERNSLSGSFTDDFCYHMPNVEVLYLYMNHLSGSIPSSIGKCRKLQKLNLSTNRFTGYIPRSIGNLTELTEIYLSNNELEGEIPVELGNLLNLEILRIEGAGLTGIVPPKIYNISSLKYIYLRNNSLSGSFPEDLCHGLPILEELNFYNNKLTGTIPKDIGNCTLLNYIAIDTNFLTGEIPEEIGKLPLSSLYMGHNSLIGSIPPNIFNISTLDIIALQFNNLSGHLPSTLGLGLPKLISLVLNRNKLSGILPSSISNASSLANLELGHNSFSGPLPNSLGDLRYLKWLDLQENNMSSEFSTPEKGFLSSLTNCGLLRHLDISSNSLNGILPHSIGNLSTSLQYLYLGNSKVKGNIPIGIGNLSNLILLSLSRNNLTGLIPATIGQLQQLQGLFLYSNRLEGTIPYDLCHLESLNELRLDYNQLNGSMPESVLPPTAAIILILTLVIIFTRPRKSKAKSTDKEAFSGPAEWRRISYLELQQATDRFSERNLLGTGGFGSVYNGILPDGMNIAVKVFNLQVEGAFESFDTECEVLRNIRHRNLIKIVSSCCNEDFRALVLEFMPNGTLEKWLYSDGCSLDILQRLDIMIDVASALEYLHHGHPVPVVHCDLKPNNVLLDEDMVAHVGDFGLAKLLGAGESVTETMRIATIGYMAPEYGSLGIVSTKGDVYSYGILLMEVFTGRKPTDELFSGEMSLKQWVKESLSCSVVDIVDANLLNAEEKHSVAKIKCVTSIMEMALDCSAESPKERPHMMDIAAMLKKIKGNYLKDVGGRRNPLSRPK
ncbi:hypothetical protein SLEP1_g6191 [Rubroshorea leprosula]|uniref:non-specific serine/threonine protein kinase n=1 Tax=Rubroshorea leprosula TaxID=152421 RepID=A0AAV5HYV0_9ROSI|nr:hypothetical protein SLEP1_g6191 [Rubroshorea leprosula]